MPGHVVTPEEILKLAKESSLLGQTATPASVLRFADALFEVGADVDFRYRGQLLQTYLTQVQEADRKLKLLLKENQNDN